MRSLWSSTLTGIALSHVESLECFEAVKHDNAVSRSLGTYVQQMVALQPWYFRMPLKVFAASVGAVCVLTMFKTLDAFTPKRRKMFLGAMRRLSVFSLLDTFVQSTTFIKFFDHPALIINVLPHSGI